jgi:hypothetical protein
MYEALTTQELNALQEILYAGAGAAFRLANLRHDREWLSRYAPVHSEVCRLFLEAGQELAGRLAATGQPSAARIPPPRHGGKHGGHLPAAVQEAQRQAVQVHDVPGAEAVTGAIHVLEFDLPTFDDDKRAVPIGLAIRP